MQSVNAACFHTQQHVLPIAGIVTGLPPTHRTWHEKQVPDAHTSLVAKVLRCMSSYGLSAYLELAQQGDAGQCNLQNTVSMRLTLQLSSKLATP